MTRPTLAAAFLTLILAPAVRAGDDDCRQKLDAALYDGLKKAHNAGADLFNSGDSLGCCRVFDGCLLLAIELLDYRPAEKRFAEETRTRAATTADLRERAMGLHRDIDTLRRRLRPPGRIVEEGPELPPRTPESKEPKRMPKTKPEVLVIPPRVTPEKKPLIVEEMKKEELPKVAPLPKIIEGPPRDPVVPPFELIPLPEK